MIIIEGPDNAGKTTLGEKLSEELGLPLNHSTRPEKSLNPDQVLMHSVAQLQPQRQIQDRVYAISEYVYGRVIRGKTALGPNHAQALMDLYSRNHLIIYCRPPTEVILSNKGRDQMEGVLKYHNTLIKEYDVLMQEISFFSSGKVIKYDYTRDRFNPLLKHCQDHLKEVESQIVSATYITTFR